MKTALIVIDVQKYFVNDETKDLPNKICKYIEGNKYDYILFTQFVNNNNSNFVKLLNWRKCFSSPETDMHDTLKKFVTTENLFKKSTYSIFKADGLSDYLKKTFYFKSLSMWN